MLFVFQLTELDSTLQLKIRDVKMKTADYEEDQLKIENAIAEEIAGVNAAC